MKKLPNDKLMKLIKKAHNGDNKAREDAIIHTMGLVIFFAKRYTWSDVEFQDIVQSGMIGLIKAIDKFDITKKVKFSTYAFYWIRTSIQEGMREYLRFIRIPTYIEIDLLKYNRLKNEFYQKEGRDATKEDMIKHYKYNKEKLKLLQTFNYERAQLEHNIDDVISNPKETKYPKLDVILENLNDKNRQFLIDKYGLKKDTDAKSYKKIGNELNKTHQAIRLREKNIFNKMRLKTVKKNPIPI